ncbi:MAG: hypothetical protein ER33_08170 [Cyanobium sp. CACIAM 14]|nr:MAG: hypothetical protein ER33_08170 [Cyanobium sp. CACIAM 14]
MAEGLSQSRKTVHPGRRRRRGACWIATTGLSAALLASCQPAPDETVLADVTHPATITFRAASAGDVHAIEISGSGSIDGVARIELLLDGKPYRSLDVHDKVAFRWRNDWYSREAVVRYTPLRVRGGSLTLRSRFETLQ